jgi:ribokinase
VRDPTGAGDAFCGGFCASLLAADDPVLAACRGTVSASFAVEGFGALHALGADRAEARRRLEGLLGRIGRRAPR